MSSILTISVTITRCIPITYQYLRQLQKADGGLRGMNTAQASDLIENLSQ